MTEPEYIPKMSDADPHVRSVQSCRERKRQGDAAGTRQRRNQDRRHTPCSRRRLMFIEPERLFDLLGKHHVVNGPWQNVGRQVVACLLRPTQMGKQQSKKTSR
jgi:hypothetical protein